MGKNIATIIFSCDRPMQLNLCLRSLYENLDEYSDIHVLYTYSNDDFKKAYETEEKKHKFVEFRRENDFKSDLLQLIHDKMYVLFVVDDCIFTNDFSVNEIEKLLEERDDIIGFSLRLGLNTKYCYPENKSQEIPEYEIYKDKMVFNWSNAEYDFGYPLELSSSIYRVKDIFAILYDCKYKNPNELEWLMYLNKDIYKNERPKLSCYKQSVAFCNPINKVQTANAVNRSGDSIEYSAHSLLTEFNKCGIIKYSKFKGFVPKGAHQEVEIEILYE